MTGVGNLGAFGRGLPAPATNWGSTLVLKLAGVALLLAISLSRTLAITQPGAAGNAPADVVTRVLRFAYGATAALLAAILALAIGLAH